MRRPARCCVVGVLVSWGALGCEEEAKKPLPPLYVEQYACELEASSSALRQLGTLNDADFWSCRKPTSGSTGVEFTEFSGVTYVVSGGSTAIDLEFTGIDTLTGHPLIIGFGRERGYYVVNVDQQTSPLHAEFYLQSSIAGGRTTLYLGIDDGTGTPEEPRLGKLLEIPIDIIKVKSGDIQISLNWDTNVDLDLHVVDPNGDEVFYGAMSVPSGGNQDLDSYAACSGRQEYNENIYWGLDRAPTGTYLVRVDYWDACGLTGTQTETHYRVTVATSKGDLEVAEGTLLPEQADQGGAGSGIEVLTIDWSG